MTVRTTACGSSKTTERH